MVLLRLINVGSVALAVSSISIAVEVADLIRENFTAYKNAILNDRGEMAAEVVTASTHSYFEELTQLAICSVGGQLAAQSPVNRMQVALLRHRVPTNQLIHMSGREVFVYAVDHGWVGKNTIGLIELAEVKPTADVAIASVLFSEQPAVGTEFRFLIENGVWKFDLVPVLASSSLLIQQLARQRSLAEDELILQLIENVAGTRPPPTIWEPLAPEHSRCTALR